jgi:hypothetical protein
LAGHIKNASFSDEITGIKQGAFSGESNALELVCGIVSKDLNITNSGGG